MINRLDYEYCSDIALSEPQQIEKEQTPVIPLPMNYRTDQNKYNPKVNHKKFLATCAKNRSKRKSKKRKNK